MNLRKRYTLIIFAVSLLLILAGTGAAYAYLSASSNEIINNFTPETETDPVINDSQGVYVDVGNPGYAVYVRAAIVVTWEKDGNVYAQMPSYTIDGLNETAWFHGSDGFYYHKQMVCFDESTAEGSTALLCNAITATSDAPDGYNLCVKIIAQTIQALGMTDENPVPAVTDAWGISVDAETKELVDNT